MFDNNFKRSPFIVASLLLFVMAPYGEARSIVDKNEFHQTPYVIYKIKAITNSKILPWLVPAADQIGNVVTMTACRGEYQAASFCVHANKDIADLRLTASELKGKDGLMRAKAVDIRVVKCWFQAGVNDVHVTKDRVLVPELLLKDENLIKVDIKNKQNYLREYDQSGKETYVLISGPNSDNMKHIQPKDTEELQPVNIAAGETRQFWITLHVPEDAAPGEYVGDVHLAATESPLTDLQLRVRVLPFTLQKPRLQYSIYYRGLLSEDGKGGISSEKKSPKQYEAEMINLKAHGVDYPTTYQNNERLIRQALDIRERADLPKGPIYTLGLVTGNSQTRVELDALKKSVGKLLRIAHDTGYGPVYVYGMDEAKDERLKSQRAAWQTVHEMGAKIFAACYKGAFESMGDLLDLAILAGPPIKNEAEKYHKLNHKIFCYANPQVGAILPETYRRNFGILLWKNGYDGAMNYAYQASFNHCWNDFDHPKYRDHMFAYPTVDGVIDTVQWEGFREGINDVRYLTTLSSAIESVSDEKTELAKRASEWMSLLNAASDLDQLRQETVDWILKLQ